MPRAFALEAAGDGRDALAATKEALRLAKQVGTPVDIAFYAGNWWRLRKKLGMVLTAESVPWGETVTYAGNGHRYARIEVPLPFAEAAALCEERGGHLATVSDEGENAFLYEMFATDRLCWLGGSDAETEGEWRWITGEPFDYSNWSKGQPNGEKKDAPREDYLNFGRFDGRPTGSSGVGRRRRAGATTRATVSRRKSCSGTAR